MDFEEENEHRNHQNVSPAVQMPVIQMNPALIQGIYGSPTSVQNSNRVHIEGLSGRDVFGRMAYSVGFSWGGGIIAGGSYGLVQGYMNSPSTKFRIRLNSVLNASGRGGSKAGNALGVLAIYYGASEWLLDYAFDSLGVPTVDSMTPILAGFTTGGLYKATKGPKTAVLAA